MSESQAEEPSIPAGGTFELNRALDLASWMVFTAFLTARPILFGFELSGAGNAVVYVLLALAIGLAATSAIAAGRLPTFRSPLTTPLVALMAVMAISVLPLLRALPVVRCSW